jgi:D-alanyl-D-alanine carboxypeptidase
MVGLSMILAATAHAGPALVFDAKDGRVLFALDQDHVWHPASLTKVMTAFMTFEAIKSGKLTPETRLTASELAHKVDPSKIGLPVGATITVELALQALIVKSANDAAIMLAEGMSGSIEAFAADMNATAKRLGMTQTNFVNPHGLPAPEQVTTARDLAKLTAAVMREYSQYAPLWIAADMRIGKRRLRSHNGLLRTYDGADGFKTGFICDSGYNVIASASREGRRLVAIVLGEPSGAARTIRAAGLLEHGFQTADWRAVLGPNHTLSTLPVPADAKSTPTVVRAEVLNRACNPNKRRVNAVAQRIKKQRQALKASAGPASTAGAPKAAVTKAAPAPAAATVAAPKAAGAKTTN